MVSSTPWPHFTPGKDPVPIVQEAGWVPGLVWTGGKSRPHLVSILDRPAYSQSLCLLSYLAHNIYIYIYICIFCKNLHVYILEYTKFSTTEILSVIFRPSNMKADHLRKFNFLALSKFGKYETNSQNSNKSFSIQFAVPDAPQTSHLVRTAKCGAQGPSGTLAGALWLLLLFGLQVGSQRYCPFTLQAGARVHATYSSALLSSDSSPSSSTCF